MTGDVLRHPAGEATASQAVAAAIVGALQRPGTRLLFGVPGGGPNLDVVGAAADAGPAVRPRPRRDRRRDHGRHLRRPHRRPGCRGRHPRTRAGQRGQRHRARRAGPAAARRDRGHRPGPGRGPDQPPAAGPGRARPLRGQGHGHGRRRRPGARRRACRPAGGSRRPPGRSWSTSTRTVPPTDRQLRPDRHPQPISAPAPSPGADGPAEPDGLADVDQADVRATCVRSSAKRSAPPCVRSCCWALGPCGTPRAVRAALAGSGIPVLHTYRARGIVPDCAAEAAGLFTGGTMESPLLAAADLIIGLGRGPGRADPGALGLPGSHVAGHRVPGRIRRVLHRRHRTGHPAARRARGAGRAPGRAPLARGGGPDGETGRHRPAAAGRPSPRRAG